jgi:DNA topoisomerase-3
LTSNQQEKNEGLYCRKPSVAREIASVLGANTKHDGYYEGNGYAVTYTFGHLCTFKNLTITNPGKVGI